MVRVAGELYRDFEQTTDAEVKAPLCEAHEGEVMISAARAGAGDAW